MVKPTKARARHYDKIRNPKGDNSNKQRHSSKRKLAKARAVLAAQRSTLSDDIDSHHSAAADILYLWLEQVRIIHHRKVVAIIIHIKLDVLIDMLN